MRFISLIFVVSLYLVLTSQTSAQLLRKNEYGAGVNIAVYQYDEAKSKKTDQIVKLNQTLSTAQEEIEHLKRTYGIEDLKLLHVRSVGMREGELFTDAIALNRKELSFTIKLRLVSKEETTLDVSAGYDGKSLLALNGVTFIDFETIMMRGGQGDFGSKEFEGPKGKELIPISRSLLITITASVQSARSMRNKPSDMSRPTDQYGRVTEITESDVFIMPSVVTRVPLKYPPGVKIKGNITLEGIISPDGRATNVKVIDSPDQGINAKAVDVFRQYKFNPAKLNGRAIYATYRETIILIGDKPL